MSQSLTQHQIDQIMAGTVFPGHAAKHPVEHIQTHLSHLFLTTDRVYKFHKAVDLGFVDFTTRLARSRDAIREVQLNRRLAPELYLGVAPLIESDPIRLGEIAEQPSPRDGPDREREYCVVMRRLPKQANALFMLRQAQLGQSHILAVARQLAGFHDQHALAPDFCSRQTWLSRIADPALDNTTAMRDLLEDAELGLNQTCRRATQSFLDAHGDWIAKRLEQGRGVDGHGDLHLEHLWFPSDHPIWIDCIAFRDDFRELDGATDIGFLAMDLIYREQSTMALRLLEEYALRRLDFDLFKGIGFFMSYRAAVRAKVAAMAANDPALGPDQRTAAYASCQRHLRLATDFISPRRRGLTCVMCGVVGSGKSTVARAIAESRAAIVVSSDRLRKHMAGVDPRDRLSQDHYTAQWTDRVYRHMRDCLSPIAATGWSTVLDATFPTASMRQWVLDLDPKAVLIWVDADDDILRRRLHDRIKLGNDPSDAGPELLDKSRAQFQPPGEWAQQRVLRVDTSHSGWRDLLLRQLDQMSGNGRQ